MISFVAIWCKDNELIIYLILTFFHSLFNKNFSYRTSNCLPKKSYMLFAWFIMSTISYLFAKHLTVVSLALLMSRSLNFDTYSSILVVRDYFQVTNSTYKSM